LGIFIDTEGEWYMKNVKRILCALISVLILFSVSCIPVYASDDEYKHFLQGDGRWSSYVYDGTDTIEGAGCALTSLAILMAYADPSLRDVNKFNPKIAADEYLCFNGNGCILWDKVQKGPLKLRGDVTIRSKGDVKKALDNGYYIVAWSSRVYYSGTHYSPIVGWDDEGDKPVIWDVAGGGKTWDDFTAKSKDISCFRVYESTKLKSKEAFAGANSTDTSDVDTDKQAEAFNNVVKEWELKGMPSKSNIRADAQDISLPDGKGLSLADKTNIAGIKDDINSRHKNIYQIMDISFSVLGFLLIVYALLLSVGYVLDKSNSFINLSMVSILTVGKIKIVDKGETISEEMKKDGYVKPNAFYIRSLVIFLVGCLLISGVIQRLVMEVVYRLIC
jgi:hypothetical protein